MWLNFRQQSSDCQQKTDSQHVELPTILKSINYKTALNQHHFFNMMINFSLEVVAIMDMIENVNFVSVLLAGNRYGVFLIHAAACTQLNANSRFSCLIQLCLSRLLSQHSATHIHKALLQQDWLN